MQLDQFHRAYPISKDNKGWIRCLKSNWAHVVCEGCDEEADEFVCEF